MEPGKEGYLAVTEALGENLLKSDGTIDRKALAARIFQDDGARKTVDDIIHPMVWKTIRDKISASQAELIVVEFAIMNEKKWMTAGRRCGTSVRQRRTGSAV